MNIRTIVFAGMLTFAMAGAQAFVVTSLSPQAEVARIRQLVVKFDEAVVNFGDPKAVAPLSLQCSDAQASQGNGRWISEREWAYEFADDLPPGVSCSVQLRSGLKSVKGANLAGSSSYQFNTGGPFVQNILPYNGSRIDEEQYFTLQLNGAASLDSVQAKVWCVVEGLGERVPVRLIDGKDRAALLKAQRLERAAEKSPLSVVTLACNRRLTPAVNVQLVWGKGVATPGVSGDRGGVANSVERRFNFKVREPFTASFNCERENAQSACLPIRPLSLSFNAPVTRKLALDVRLKSDKETRKPVFDKEGEDGADDSVVTHVSFKGVLPESTQFTLELPRDFKDASGRSLRNADSFPLKVATAQMPPLVKFSAAPFGIVERFSEPNGVALLPVTLRNVEAALKVSGITLDSAARTSKVSDLRPSTDADIIAWFNKVQRYDESSVQRKLAADEVQGPLPKALDRSEKNKLQSRMVSLLQGQSGVKTLDLPRPASHDPRPFEVVGIPLSPGFHVIEIASQTLGASLLDARHGDGRTMYVRSSALVTNLGVHFKLGRENALAWVTTLDKGQPVANARVRVSDCHGVEVASASTDAQGLARMVGISLVPPRCRSDANDRQAYFVSARALQGATESSTGKDMVEDMSFTWSDWHRGIEPWRFNLPTSREARPDERAHTIFDRTLLRAGETVSMKHILRTETAQGFALSKTQPNTLVVTHVGSAQQYTQPLVWRSTATGGQSAESSFAIPAGAKLGQYQVQLRGAARERSFETGTFRVEEFRLPVLEGRVTPTQKQALVNVKSVPVDVQVNYVGGGAAADLPVRVSALVRAKSLNFSDFDAFSFSPPRGKNEATTDDDEERDADTRPSRDARVIADKMALTLDKDGAGKVTLDKVPAARQPLELLLEASYADPNG
ncbi:MAG: MG2 domain-containing protein, partial [Betaproteobacteria bacterium]